MKPTPSRCIAIIAACALVACSRMSSFESPQSGTRLMIKDDAMTLPASRDLRGTSFGNYEFEASQADADPFYGILPLKFKGGHLAADIILFAPAAFFNLRSVFPFYEIDVAAGVIRYKEKRSDAWTEYRPKPEEAQRAREFFAGRSSTGNSSGRNRSGVIQCGFALPSAHFNRIDIDRPAHATRARQIAQ